MSDLAQQYKQALLNSILSGVQQPTAQLQETSAGAAAAGASAGLSAQNTANAALQQQQLQAGVDRLNIIKTAGDIFKKSADKNGYVDPKLYNAALGSWTQAGGDATDFHNKFENQYVNPNNVFYDTPDAKAARGALPVIKQVVDSYNNLHTTGQAVKDMENIPIIGNYIKQNLFHAQSAHDTFLTGEVGNIRQIAGAGPSQGFRFNLNELNNIAGLLPTSYDNKATANDKLDQLNTFLQEKMGTSLKDVVKGQ